MRVGYAIAVVAAVGLSGCGSGLQFRNDHRIRLVSPPERADVTLPLLVSWEVDAGSRRERFAVFVDRSPMGPGEDLRSLADDEPLCSRRPDCPDSTWLAERGVFLTETTALLIRTLPPEGLRRVGARRRHEVTVVLLDGRDVRIGEAAWTRSFYTRPPGSE